MLLGHGGNIGKVINSCSIPRSKILDYSSNINPLGISQRVKDFISENTLFRLITHYPDPECKSLRQVLSDYLDIDAENIITGNGSNELIHLVPRVLKCRRALIYQPAFSEYALSLNLAQAKTDFLFAQEQDDFSININKIIAYVPKVELIILCNPNNPTGYLLKKEPLLELIRYCLKYKTYLLIDEAFMEFVDNSRDISLIKQAAIYKNLLVLRSITKFFSLPGLRAGYLTGNKELIGKFKLFQPTWSVNAFVQETAEKSIADSGFIKKSKAYIKKEREFLFNSLKRIKQVYPYPPAANFIFCKILNNRLGVQDLSKQLIKSGVLIRDCSNFKGLDSRFFRVAVRKRKDNLYLLSCLKSILK